MNQLWMPIGTLGDLAFAAAVARMILPEGNRPPIPPLAQLPPADAAVVRELQPRPAAKLVQAVHWVMKPAAVGG